MGIAGAIILARKLTPADYGLFAIASTIVSVFAILGDLGFASYFVHAEAPPSVRDLRVSFTAQVIFATGVVTVIWVIAPWAVHFWPLVSPSAVWLVRVIAIGGYLDVFRSLYRLQFERNMNYGPIARADVAEALFYQIVAIGLALAGFGAWTLVLALLASEGVSTMLLAIMAPVPARFRFDFRRMRELLPKTIRFQLYAPVNALGDMATPMVVGRLLGPAGVGFLGFASANARRPLILVEAVTRVSFPHFSRVKHEPDALREVLVRYLLGFFWIVLFWAAGVVAAGGPAVEKLYTAKWLPAMPALMLFSIMLPLDAVSWLMGQAFAAVGRAMVPVGIVAFRSLLLIALAIALIRPFGILAIPLAYFGANLITAPMQLRLFERGLLTLVLKRSMWMAVPAAGAVAAGRGCLMWLGQTGWHGPLQRAFVGAIPAAIAYLALTYVLVPARYRQELHRLIRRPRSLFRDLEPAGFDSPRPDGLG